MVGRKTGNVTRTQPWPIATDIPIDTPKVNALVLKSTLQAAPLFEKPKPVIMA